MLSQLAATVFAAALWTGVALRARLRGRRRRIPDSPAPPAVAALLENPERKQDPEVLNATVLELAELGALEVIPADSQGPAMVRTAVIPHPRQVPAYQASLIGRVLARQGPNGRPVPFTALVSGEDHAARDWFAAFNRSVRRDAVGRGLLQKALPRREWLSMILGGVAVSAVCAVAVMHYAKPATYIPFLSFVLLDALVVTTVRWAATTRLTPAGRAALAAVHERPSLTSAAPRQVAGQIAVLPTQLTPLPQHQVWSNYGGSWHPLNVRSKTVFRPRQAGRGYAPLLLAGAGCLASGLGTIGRTHTVNVPLLAAFVALPSAVLLAALGRTLLRRKLPRREVIRGQLAKISTTKTSVRNGSVARDLYFCTLDTGQAPESVQVLLPASKAVTRLQVGETIEVLVNPRTRVVKDLRLLGPDPLL